MGPSLAISVFIQFLCIYNIVESQDYLGCYLDSGTRMLGHDITFSALTPEICIDYCQKIGYTYAGLQQKTYCYCGVQAPANLKRKESECNMECAGNKSEICGGSWRNSVYRINNPRKDYEYIGCFKDQENPRVLSGFNNYLKNMAPKDCIDMCRGFGYLFGGNIYGTRCFCGNGLDLSNERPISECNYDCSGDSQRKCGGFYRPAIYSTGIYSGPSIAYGGNSCDQPSAPVNSVKSCNSETCTITCLDDYAFPDGSTVVNITCKSGSWKPTRTDWSSVPGCKVKFQEYLGCYVDSANRMYGHSALFYAQTVDMCIDYCQKLGYKFAGVQSKTDCHCGIEAPNREKASEKDCNMECPGNKSEKCGGNWRSSVYKITKPKTAYGYLGCYKDQDNPRELLGFYRAFNDLIPFQCVTVCKTLGYAYAGLQGGSTCYCGNQLQPDIEKLADSACNTRCSGDSNFMCGGSYKNSIYYTGTCTTPCQNGGTCSSYNTCECGENFYGSTCQYKYCSSYPPTPANSAKTCDSKKCTIICLDNYKFPDGSSKVEIQCNDGDWGTATPDCKATCTTPCQNGGTCVSPNTCACTGNFYGSSCQLKRCTGYPSTPANSIKSCDSEKCTIKCLDGYKLSDGSTTAQTFCNDGKWEPTISDCKATCTTPCQNGGTCVSPNTCACPENFYGSTCQLKRCTGYPSTPANSIKTCDSEKCTIKCLDNYKFSDGSTTAQTFCKDGKWEPTVSDCIAVATCNSPCQNGGTCVSTNTCACPANFYGSSCQLKRCTGYPSTPANSIKTCDSEKCTIKCLDGYKLSDGSTTAQTFCNDGKWEPTISDCKATCTSPCQNGGTCISPNTCACPDKFIGSSCEKKGCVGYPPTPANSNKACNLERCTITCLQKFEFPGLSTTVNVSCVDGVWVPSNPNWSSVPDCKESLKQYIGCYEEAIGSKMMGHAKKFDNLTVDVCTDYCRTLGYSYFGLQYRSECFCGDYLPDSKMKVDDSKCDFACSGDSNQKCGSSGRNSVYKILNPLKAFTYVGCYSDDTEPRLLKDYYKYFERLLPFQCAEYCKGQGSTYAGLKAGFRCFCGTLTLPSDKKVAEEQCNTRCAGDVYKLCGGSSTDSVYATGL